jgi:hypothetical protein
MSDSGSPIPRRATLAEPGIALYVDFALPFVLAQYPLRYAPAHRRLNAIENILALLSRPWRPGAPVIRHAAELRLSAATRDALLQWVRADEPDGGLARSRLLVYQSPALIDDAVPDGWLRLLLSPRDTNDEVSHGHP